MASPDFVYEGIVEYEDPTEGVTKELHIYHHSARELTEQEHYTAIYDKAIDIIDRYKLEQLGILDPSVLIGSIELIVGGIPL